jgi:hypothetical protein
VVKELRGPVTGPYCDRTHACALPVVRADAMTVAGGLGDLRVDAVPPEVDAGGGWDGSRGVADRSGPGPAQRVGNVIGKWSIDRIPDVYASVWPSVTA